MKSSLFFVCLAAFVVLASANPLYKEALIETLPICPAFCRPQGVYLLPHFQRCHSYYRCTHGFLIELDCPLYTLFDIVTLSCVEYQSVNCIFDGPASTVGIN